MSELSYSVKVRGLDGHHTLSGTIALTGGENRLVLDLPEGIIEDARASMSLEMGDDERVFMNGFQSWTFCPEYSSDSKIRSLRRLPDFIVEKNGLDRYGDSFFYEYPDKKGVTHGFSYCYFRRGESYRLFASLDERPGYTQFLYDHENRRLEISRDCAGVKSGGEYHVFDLYSAVGTENQVFDGWFEAMGVKLRTKEKLAGYSSWYNRYEDISAQSILEDLEGSAKVLQPGDLFQIDDGWEAAVGDWLIPDAVKFPDGMAAAAKAIHDKGLKAGLWLAPFSAKKGSRLIEEHPDWLYKHDGEPWYAGVNWGGFYALDIDNPEVVAYVEQVFDTVVNKWGFDLVKLDFLYCAAPYGNERESRAGRMIRAMELLRRVCGEAKILGCGVPLMPAFGLVDYCRISCDVGLDWDDKPHMRLAHRERVSTRQAIGNSIFRRQLCGRAFWSDPDVFFLRDDNLKLTERQKEMLSDICSIFNGIMLTSDNLGAYDEKKLERYRALRDRADAADVKVESEGDTYTVSYTLHGQRQSFTVNSKGK